MAWNEPGNSGDNKDKDPWGKQRGNDGPPDLEDVVKNLQNKVTRIFGGGRGGRGGRGNSGGGGISSASISMILVLLAGIWFFSGLYIVKDGSQGVVLQFGKYIESTNSGLHWYPRFIQTVDIVEVERSRSIRIGVNTDESLMLTSDENIVDLKFEVQYKIKDAKEYLFNVVNPDDTVKSATESALREIVGNNKMNYVLERNDVAQRTGELIQTILDRYDTGILIEAVNLDYSEAPEEVKPAFDDVNSAEQDRDRFIEEAKKYQNQILPIARGEAARITQEAEAYKAEVVARAKGDAERFTKLLVEYKKAPKVTRERLYLETMEEVLANNSKVMIDVKQGNNLLYIPVDQLNKKIRSEKTSDLHSKIKETESKLPNQQALDPRDRTRLRSRSREDR